MCDLVLFDMRSGRLCECRRTARDPAPEDMLTHNSPLSLIPVPVGWSPRTLASALRFLDSLPQVLSYMFFGPGFSPLKHFRPAGREARCAMSRPVLKFSVLKTGFALESETRRSSAAGATRVRVLGPVARVAWPGQLAMSTKACPMPKVPQPRVALGPVAKSMAPAAPRQSRVLGAVPREGPRGGPSLLQTHRHAPKLGQVPKCGAKRPRESYAGQVLGPAPRRACAVPVARAEQVKAKPEGSPCMPMSPTMRAALEPRGGKRKRPSVLGAVPREAKGARSR